jgi:hypothetical protein
VRRVDERLLAGGHDDRPAVLRRSWRFIEAPVGDRHVAQVGDVDGAAGMPEAYASPSGTETTTAVRRAGGRRAWVVSAGSHPRAVPVGVGSCRATPAVSRPPWRCPPPPQHRRYRSADPRDLCRVRWATAASVAPEPSTGYPRAPRPSCRGAVRRSTSCHLDAGGRDGRPRGTEAPRSVSSEQVHAAQCADVRSRTHQRQVASSNSRSRSLPAGSRVRRHARGWCPPRRRHRPRQSPCWPAARGGAALSSRLRRTRSRAGMRAPTGMSSGSGRSTPMVRSAAVSDRPPLQVAAAGLSRPRVPGPAPRPRSMRHCAHG